MIRPYLSMGVLALTTIAGRASAIEPNETFATATVLSPGVLSVADELSGQLFPDTILGVRDHFGTIYASDDDGSPLGDGYASGLGGVPTNSGSIDFVVTGYDDYSFVGSHDQRGHYEVFVDVYDFFGDLVDSFSETHILQPGAMHDFFYSDFEWHGGSYDVYIDNTVGPTDVDFFTFTGLSPGVAFTARTLDPNLSGIDTYLGWFDSDGTLLMADDDGGGGPSGFLSLIEGIVPADGLLTFAVTGYGDVDFIGQHSELGAYELLLEVVSAALPGDFNHDQVVDAADYVAWRKGSANGVYTPADYEVWRAHYGESADTIGSGSATATRFFAQVPEPFAVWLIAMGGMTFAAQPRPRRKWL